MPRSIAFIAGIVTALAPSIAHADEAGAHVEPAPAPPPESSARFFVHGSVGIGRAGIFTAPFTLSSTRVPMIVGVGVRKEKLFITAADVADPGETDHGVAIRGSRSVLASVTCRSRA